MTLFSNLIWRLDFHLLVSTFALIFIAEMPDKTALATVLMASKNKPLPVFIGVAAAFLVQTIVAVAFGGVFRMLPAATVKIAAAILFFVFAALMWRQRQEQDANDEFATQDTREPGMQPAFVKVMASSFLVIFIAEWGDLTQLATATLVADTGQMATIFIGSVLGLWAASGIAVFLGARLKHWLRPRLLATGGAVAFVLVGIWELVTALHS